MLLTLTDHLTCPRCGPTAGLILLMEEADDRRVRTGTLGCPMCRTRYPVVERVADLRGAAPARSATAPETPGTEAGPEVALRVAALMGLGEGRGFAVVDGAAALDAAGTLAARVPDYEIVVPIVEESSPMAAGLDVSALLAADALPLADRTMRAAAWVGGVPPEARLRELLRVCRPTGRLVVELGRADEDAEQALDRIAAVLGSAGAEVRARDATGLVAVAM